MAHLDVINQAGAALDAATLLRRGGTTHCFPKAAGSGEGAASPDGSREVDELTGQSTLIVEDEHNVHVLQIPELRFGQPGDGAVIVEKPPLALARRPFVVFPPDDQDIWHALGHDSFAPEEASNTSKALSGFALSSHGGLLA